MLIIQFRCCLILATTCSFWFRTCSSSFCLVKLLCFYVTNCPKTVGMDCGALSADFDVAMHERGLFETEVRLLCSRKFIHEVSFVRPAIFRGAKPACLHRMPESPHVSSWCDVGLLCSLQHRHLRAGSRYTHELPSFRFEEFASK